MSSTLVSSYHTCSTPLGPLSTYMDRITTGVSDVCPECGVAPHSVEHLFNCSTRPTQLTVQDLWDNPAEVADFLNMDSWCQWTRREELLGYHNNIPKAKLIWISNQMWGNFSPQLMNNESQMAGPDLWRLGRGTHRTRSPSTCQYLYPSRGWMNAVVQRTTSALSPTTTTVTSHIISITTTIPALPHVSHSQYMVYCCCNHFGNWLQWRRCCAYSIYNPLKRYTKF